MFLNCSTRFGWHTAHHRELKNCNCSLWFYISLWLLVAAMAAIATTIDHKHMQNQRLQLQFLSSWWWAVCSLKHVEQLRNNEIINATTWLHLVGSFYEIYITMHGSMTHQIHQSLQYIEVHFLRYFSKVRRHCFKHQQKIILILELK